MSKHLSVDVRVPVEEDNPSIKRIESLCIQCGKCQEVCRKEISVGHHYDLSKTMDTAICIHCGQCVNVCPTGALVEKQDWMKVHDVIQSHSKKVIAITSPSVRVGLGDAFGLEAGSYVEKKMVSALRELGVDVVFDTTFAADLTIMEEASELIDRITNNKPLPQFTSCCPAWVKFVETYYPSLLPNISSSKSPISMMAPTIKTWYAKRENIDPKDIYLVAITPCTAKKFEITRSEMKDASLYHDDEAYPDCDIVVTTKELANWMKAENLDLEKLEDSEYDSLMPRGSGAGLIFGNTGGVMEAAVRTAYFMLTEKQPPENLLEMKEIRGLEGIREASVTINDLTVNVAIVYGTENVRKFLPLLKEKHYDFVEVMTCPKGCISGGGQPKHIGEDMNEIQKKRVDSIYQKDASMKLRCSHDNPAIHQVYEEFYGLPLSELSKKLLHTTYHVRDDLNEDPSIYDTVCETEEVISTSTRYKCSICGYIYEGDLALEKDDFVCPICGVGKDLFEKC